MKPMIKALLLIVAMAMSFPAVSHAQTALNQVRLAAAVTSTASNQISLTVADSVAVGDILFVDQEAMVATAVNTTTDVVTVARGSATTSGAEHLSGAIVWTGPVNRFYFVDPGSGRCTANAAYPGGFYPWINITTGDTWYCNDNLMGRSNAVAGNWQNTTLTPYGPAVWPYTPIAYRTSRAADATVITPSYSVKLTDVLIASLTYSGPFEVFLHAPTGMLGKRVIISDFARLNSNAATSTAGRTITIRGLFDTDTSVTLARWEQFEDQYGATTERLTGAGATTSFYVGITASSMYYWFASPW